ncbi:hypothetical protein ACF2SH_005323, partial [Escherichia coli]
YQDLPMLYMLSQTRHLTGGKIEKKASLEEKTIAVNAGMETLKLSLQRNIKEINDNPINPATEPGFLCLTIPPPKNT